METRDPRVFFAAERTLLAWMRTGITIVGLSFVVSRFGLFLRFLAAQLPVRAVRPDALVSSAVLGIVFVIIGGLTVAGAGAQHARFVATLGAGDLPPSYSRQWALWLCALVSVASFVLAGYLSLTLD